MTEMKIGIIIVVVIFIIWHLYCINSTAEDYLSGLWSATEDRFCEDAGIDAMMLYISKSSGWRNTRDCYLIISPDIAGEEFVMRLRPSLCMHAYKKHWKAKLEGSSLWPERVTVEQDMIAGTLKVYDEETTYARLYKQHDL